MELFMLPFQERILKHTVLSFCTLCLTTLSLSTYTPKIHAADIETHVVTNKLNKPWGITLLPNNRALITEKTGNLLVVNLSTGEKEYTVKGLPNIEEVGQGGLLDVAIDPNFSKTPWVYLSYVQGEDSLYGTEVGRGKLINGELKDFETLFVAHPKKRGPYHFGSRLVFDKQGHLFITLGDRGDRFAAQNIEAHIGGIVRIDLPTHTTPSTAFMTDKKALPELYSMGNRNVQGAALHPLTGELWAHEHGPQGGDEINIIRAGKNYGWPIITYGKEYGLGSDIGEGTHKEGIESPVWQWTPSIAPSGMAFYYGDAFPQWRGNILVGALKYQMLVRLSVNGEKVKEEERLFKKEFGRIRDVEVDDKGFIYLLTDSTNGELIRIQPKSVIPQDVIKGE